MSINLRDRAQYEKDYICLANWKIKCDFKYLKNESYYTYCISNNIECEHKKSNIRIKNENIND
ncbi:MAG: hypothetical protein M0R17_02670 [Candidatus Omnitrophica bacterium]|jgi:hypothetical protein|nr:hypothetical protein [Candidatus Omnitrophota bacterium]